MANDKKNVCMYVCATMTATSVNLCIVWGFARINRKYNEFSITATAHNNDDYENVNANIVMHCRKKAIRRIP